MSRRQLVLAAWTVALVLFVALNAVGLAVLGDDDRRSVVLVQVPTTASEIESVVRSAVGRAVQADVDLVVLVLKVARPAPTAPPGSPEEPSPAVTPTSSPTSPEANPRPGAEDLPRLQQGEQGAEVLYLKVLLRERGFDPGPDDDLFNAPTHEAVRAFQRSRQLTDDGVVGPRTWAALYATPPISPTTFPTTSSTTSATTTTTTAPAFVYGAPLLPPGAVLAVDNSPVPTAVVAVEDQEQALELLKGARVFNENGDVLAHGSATSTSPLPSLIAFILATIAPVAVVTSRLIGERPPLGPSRSTPTVGLRIPAEVTSPASGRINRGEPPVAVVVREPAVVRVLAKTMPDGLPDVVRTASAVDPTGYVKFGRWLLPVEVTEGSGQHSIDPGVNVAIRPAPTSRRDNRHGQT